MSNNPNHSILPSRSFHVMTKPIGPLCNLDCTYCFYLEKEKLFPQDENYRMSDEVLETYIRKYIQSQNTPEIQKIRIQTVRSATLPAQAPLEHREDTKLQKR